MYLKRLKINNYRKFGTEDNIVDFSDAEAYENAIDNGDVNVATTTTLIVGKNNAGKTTVVNAIEKITSNTKMKASDFNYDYLKQNFDEYKKGVFERSPKISFEITIGLDKGLDDYVTNIAPFMLIEDLNASEIVIVVTYELKDEVTFFEECKAVLSRGYSKDVEFEKFLTLLDSADFKPVYYNKSQILVTDFKLSDLMEFVMIKANSVGDEQCLSETFNKIIRLRYQELFQSDKTKLEDSLIRMNSTLTKQIERKHTKEINATIKRIVTSSDIQVNLSADLTFEKMMRNLIRYEYVENNNRVPENQFGMGYTNLMMIIAHLIEYIEKYPDEAFNSKINLIAIEEPETYMHPQMQELFITYINDAISTLLSINNKHPNSQLIITTHSTHILNSKIQSGGSFNCINYITSQNGKTVVLPLSDTTVAPNCDVSNDAFTFIKKHIKYQFADLFFADAVVLVEGISEYTLLPYYVSEHKSLKRKYISIININGAHGLVYEKLIRYLRIPTLIITDLDIKRDDIEKNTFKQIGKLTNRTTTNQTLVHFNGSHDLSAIADHLQVDNIYVAYQGKVGHYYATSFEEAFIATNFRNGLLNCVLKQLKPKIYEEIVGPSRNLNYNKKYSYKWQKKLAESKSNFANELLYEILIADADIPKLPSYIADGLDYLATVINN